MTAEQILNHLKGLANPENVAGMARFGINAEDTLGVSMPVLREVAKSHRREHALALALWDSGIHEARILAALVDDPIQVTPRQADAWVGDLDSWDTCDQLCNNLLRKTPFAWDKAVEWSRDEREFVKRAGYVMVCTLAVHDKKAPDAQFLAFFPEIVRGCTDPRNFVKKAVNWAIRQIGKRNRTLHPEAVRLCEVVRSCDTPSARWIASDAMRDLHKEAVLARLGL